MRRALLILPASFILLLAVVAVRTALQAPAATPRAISLAQLPPAPSGAAERLAAALRLDTSERTPAQERALTEYIAKTYPKLTSTLERLTPCEHALVWRWTGSDPQLPPALVMGHLDVVPVDAPERWTHPPFSGHLADDFVWGRGALDDKGPAFAILEATESAISAQQRPKRTTYLVFGFDEEVGGTNGARCVAEAFAVQKLRFASVLDEGLVVVSGVMPGLDKPLALIGIAEKGAVSIELDASTPGGHSSMPARDSAIVRISRAITTLVDEPMPAHINAISEEMLGLVGPHMRLPERAIFANLWLFKPVLRSIFDKKPATAALLRTTTAPTIMQAGVKDNVIPEHARAVVNFRIAPGDSSSEVIAEVQRHVEPLGVTVKGHVGLDSEPSPVSDTHGEEYQRLAATVAAVFPEAIVAPGLVVGVTDSRHFATVADAVFRFAPLALNNADLARIHGTDERLAIANYERMMTFYAAWLLGL